jgi:hypothetical protein
VRQGSDRAIGAAGPGSDPESLRTAYLDLLKLALCDLAGARTSTVTTTGNLRDPEAPLHTEELTGDQLSLRVKGADWPLSGLSMIGLERLDGDTYEATWLTLDALYPGLSAGGYVIVDDYTLIRECRQAVDDYRREHRIEAPLVKDDWCSARWRREDEPR